MATLAAPAGLANGRRALFGALATGVLLAGCAPNLGPLPKPAAPQSYATTTSFDAPAAEWPSDDWWTAYGDPQLDSLMVEALKGAPDLRIAEARVRQAQALAEQAGAYRLPALSANGAEYEARIGQSIGLPPQFASALPSGFGGMTQVGANLSYQLDFFGKNRAAFAAATSAADAARADRAAARLQLTAAVAIAYANFVRLSEDRETAADAVRVRQDTLKLVDERRRNGLETRGVVSQEAATVSDAKAEVEALDLQVLQVRHQIAALLGEGPDRGLQIERSPNAGALLHPIGLPSSLALNLVGRRPDIVAARLRAEAARQRIKSAKADFYPNIDLTGSFIAASLGDKSLLQHNVNLTRFGPAVTLPIFSGGQLEGAYRGARGEYDEAVATYDKTLANALRDVADAIAGARSLQGQLADARASLASDEDAYAVAKLRYQGGLSPYLNVLTAENAVLQQRQTVVNLAVQSLLSDIDLVRALGGGYVAPAAAGHTSSTR
jgi:NodT family efflux transporter outer membrane factor (OMF) lipoprotein